MDWDKIGKDFEKWRKKFLAKRDYQTYDLRRDLEPTGNEKQPDVYRGNKSELPWMPCAALILTPGHRTPSPEEVMNMVRTNTLAPQVEKNRGKLYKSTRGKVVVKDDVVNIKISLENSNDVNEFLKEI